MLRKLFCGLCGLVPTTVAMSGQSQNASLDGQVTDKSGAVMPQAAVTVSAADTHLNFNV